MATKIKNKQTGETLTGEVIANDAGTGLVFKIQGCEAANTLTPSEWEILPPPLPTGLGAVVEARAGNHFVRVNSGLWKQSEGGIRDYKDTEIIERGPLIVLSEGVQL